MLTSAVEKNKTGSEGSCYHVYVYLCLLHRGIGKEEFHFKRISLIQRRNCFLNPMKYFL